jgi:hypothetical protein
LACGSPGFFAARLTGFNPPESPADTPRQPMESSRPHGSSFRIESEGIAGVWRNSSDIGISA